jgi:hypothetical protein
MSRIEVEEDKTASVMTVLVQNSGRSGGHDLIYLFGFPASRLHRQRLGRSGAGKLVNDSSLLPRLGHFCITMACLA